MKIRNANKHKYIPRQLVVEQKIIKMVLKNIKIILKNIEVHFVFRSIKAIELKRYFLLLLVFLENLLIFYLEVLRLIKVKQVEL